MKRALFVAGGWPHHFPEKTAELFSNDLRSKGFETVIDSSLERLADVTALKSFDVIFLCWTMGELTLEQSNGLQEAVRTGTGLAGVHGGMGDAFRGNLAYEWMTGGHFVGHPHFGEYTVHIRDPFSPITADLPSTFAYKSEQYYMMMDPAVHVLADTIYTLENDTLVMPVSWIRKWGQGRVFYNALGHTPEEFEQFPAARKLTVQGVLWAAQAL